MHLLLHLLTSFLIIGDPFIQCQGCIIGVRAETVNNMIFIEFGATEIFDIFLGMFDHTLRINIIMDIMIQRKENLEVLVELMR